MSTFTSYQSFLIPLGSTVLNCHTTIRSALTTAGWKIVHDDTLTAINAIIGTWNNVSYPISGAYNWSFTNCLQAPVFPIWTGIQLVNSTQMTQLVIGGSIDTPGRCPKNFTIDYADDNGSGNPGAWTTALTVNNCTNWYTYERRYFNIPAVGIHEYWRINITANNGDGSWVGVSSIEFLDTYGNTALTQPASVTPTTYFEAMPPSAIGDANSRELIRFEFSSTAIGMRPVAQCLNGMYQTVTLWNGNAGNVQYGFVLGGSALVQQAAGTMSSLNSSAQNLRFLYDAIKASADPVINGYTWQYQTPATQNASDGNEYIYGRKNSVNTPGTGTGGVLNCTTSMWEDTLTSVTNVSGLISGRSVQPGAIPCNYPYYAPSTVNTVNIDLINGFIYYLSISHRGLALATKTNTSFYGPVHACYGDNATAIAVKPVTAYPQEITPIELLIGTDGAATSSLTSSANISHGWVMQNGASQNLTSNNMQANNYIAQLYNRSIFRSQFMDCNSNQFPSIPLEGSNIWNGDSINGYQFQIHKMSQPNIYSFWNGTNLGSFNNTGIVGQVNLTDWYKFRGTANNEALVLVADTITYTTLGVNIALGANPTSITLASAANFAPSGYVAINDEIFQYTGVSGNTLTGITRSVYGSVPRSSYVGDTVYQCLWFTIINGGALLCGFNHP